MFQRQKLQRKSNEITWKYLIELERPQIAIKCFAEKMSSSCRISKARIQTHNSHNVYSFLLLHGNGGYVN